MDGRRPAGREDPAARNVVVAHRDIPAVHLPVPRSTPSPPHATGRVLTQAVRKNRVNVSAGDEAYGILLVPARDHPDAVGVGEG